MQTTALAWLLFRLTGSATSLGLLTLAQFLPGLVVGPLAGALADRSEKRRIVLSAQAVFIALAATLAVLSFTGTALPWHLYLIALLSGVAMAVETPARQVLVVEIVGADDLPSAVGLNSAVFNGARLVGPAVAGAVVARWGEAWCFASNAALYLAFAAALAGIRPRPPAPGGRDSGAVADLLEGLRFVRSTPATAALLGLVAVASVGGLPYYVLLPAHVRRAFGGGAETFGLLSASVGAGALCGALLLAARPGTDGLGRLVARGAFGFGLALVAFGAAPTIATSAAALAAAGAGFMLLLGGSNTLLQTLAPHRLRGRVIALFTALCVGTFPLGGFGAGWLADRVGERPVLILGGAAVAAAALAFRRALRGVPAAPDATAPEAEPPEVG